MRRALAAIAVALAIPAIASAGRERPDPERLLVRGSEFELTLSKPKLRPGRAVIQFLNDGEDPHDLRLQRTDGPGGPEFGVGELAAGEYVGLEVRLHKRATYLLWCSISDHRGRGMEASLRTKKRRR